MRNRYDLCNTLAHRKHKPDATVGHFENSLIIMGLFFFLLLESKHRPNSAYMLHMKLDCQMPHTQTKYVTTKVVLICKFNVIYKLY